jgi:hypothetical protein
MEIEFELKTDPILIFKRYVNFENIKERHGSSFSIVHVLCEKKIGKKSNK